MRNLGLVLLFCLVIILTLSVAASAQRPDPTGQGRYFQFGQEVSYPNAQVIKQLPTGAECAPAGELVDVELWNSTRPGKAILSKLTDKAQVAITSDNRMFLCYCAAGYNQLFLLETKKTVTTPLFQQEVATQNMPSQSQSSTSTASVTVQGTCGFQTIPIQNGTGTFWVCPGKDPQLFSTVTNPPLKPEKEEKEKKGCGKGCKALYTLLGIGIGVVIDESVRALAGGGGSKKKLPGATTLPSSAGTTDIAMSF